MHKKFNVRKKRFIIIKKSICRNINSVEIVEKDVIQWHSAFYSAMRLEFKGDSKKLEFYPETILNTAPLKVDLLILLLNKEEKLKNLIGRNFRIFNILDS